MSAVKSESTLDPGGTRQSLRGSSPSLRSSVRIPFEEGMAELEAARPSQGDGRPPRLVASICLAPSHPVP